MPRPWWPCFKATKTIFELIQDIIGTNLLTKFHYDRKINVTSRVKIATPRGGHVFQPTGIIFELFQDIIGMNLLTEFHEDRTINVASRVKNAPPHGGHVFQANITIFELIQNINKTNLLTICHQDWTKNVASRVLTIKEKCPAPWRPCFSTNKHHFRTRPRYYWDEYSDHEDWTINVASRVKNAPPLGSHVFQAKVTIFELIQYISGTNLLSKFHEDRKINVASRVLTRKNALPPGGHVFQPTGIIFELVQDIIGMNHLNKFYENQTITVSSRVLTRFYYSHIRKNALPLGSHVLQANVTIFKLIQGIIETNLLTKFHEHWAINVASRELTSQMLTPHAAQRTTYKRLPQKLTISTLCSVSRKSPKELPRYGSRHKSAGQKDGRTTDEQRQNNIPLLMEGEKKLQHTNGKIDPPFGSHVFKANIIIFKLIQDIIETNLLTKFHEDWTINVASRVLTRKYAPPPGGHAFKATQTIFKLIQDIIGTNLLTKFHDDRTINVTSRVLTRKNAQPPWWLYIIGMKLLTEFHEDRTINVASRVKNAPPLGSHVFQSNTNLLTKFHKDWTINKVPVPRDFFGYLWDNWICSSSHCVNTFFFVTVNNGGGGGGGGGGGIVHK
ncbi:hypothetical protein DPMN_016040 [Dreissena polymorpha]|uniref:Uncharacterized protein n=1 Tax=Dreissena polymorpha TaxID=45954 RepID=A0A9D4S621_DREPO|nr:hypothetical protein DPMN_016040 [Dreissena polymorpha]